MTKYYDEGIKKIQFLKNIPQFEQKSAEWLNHRKTRLTSSDAACAIGTCPYNKPVKLLFKKNDAGEPFNTNEAIFHGNLYEQEAVNLYCKLMNKKNYEFGLIGYESLNLIRKPSKELDLFKKQFPHIDLEFCGGSPDGICVDLDDKEDLIMLEVKCPFRRKPIFGKCPIYYAAQVQMNMFILDIEQSDFVEYLPSNCPPNFLKEPVLNIVRMHRDYDWFFKYVPILYDFWQEVLYWRSIGIINHPEYLKHAYNPDKIKKTRIKKTNEESPKQGSKSPKQTTLKFDFDMEFRDPDIFVKAPTIDLTSIDYGPVESPTSTRIQNRIYDIKIIDLEFRD